MHVPVNLYHRLSLVFLYPNLNASVWHHEPSGESPQVMTMALVGKSAIIFMSFGDFWPYKEALLKSRSSLAEEQAGRGN